MKFNRHFKLLPYWGNWYARIERKRKAKKTETEIVELDGIKYGMGGHSVTIPPEAVKLFISEDLKRIYHRDNLALKIFYRQPILLNSLMYECFWGGEGQRIIDTSRIQNIIALNKMAPRVYDLIFLIVGDFKFVAQVTDFVQVNKVEEEILLKLIKRLEKIAKKHDIYNENTVIPNFVGREFVDFGRWYFSVFYKEKLQQRATRNLKFAGSKLPYQSVEGLQVKGQRNNVERQKILEREFAKDKKLLPRNFTVIDYGCSGGFFLRRAFDWGAKYAVGVDTKKVIDITSEISYFLDYFNIDFMTELPKEQFDLAFFLSMDRHVSFEEFIPCVKKLLYLEGHSGDTKEKYMEMLKPHFKNVQLIGKVSDYGERVLFKAIR